MNERDPTRRVGLPAENLPARFDATAEELARLRDEAARLAADLRACLQAVALDRQRLATLIGRRSREGSQ
jgi:hypothetical protein